MRPQAGLRVNPIKKFRERDGGNAVPQPADDIGDARKGVSCPGVHTGYFAATSGGNDVPVRSPLRRTDARRCSGSQQFNRFVANAAWWHVQDALVRDTVSVAAQHAEPGKRIFHLAALIEACAADQLVRNTRSQQGLFNRA